MFGKHGSRGCVINQRGWEGRFIAPEVGAHTGCGQPRYHVQEENTSIPNMFMHFRVLALITASQITPLIVLTQACMLYIATKSSEERKEGGSKRKWEGGREMKGRKRKRKEKKISHIFLFCFILTTHQKRPFIYRTCDLSPNFHSQAQDFPSSASKTTK